MKTKLKRVIYNGEIYIVEEEALDFYKLTGEIWVKKSECEEIEFLKITKERVFLALAIAFVLFHVSRILIIEIAKL